MTKFRVVERHGKYYPQYKLLLFWCNFTRIVGRNEWCDTKEEAIKRITSKRVPASENVVWEGGA